MKALLLPFTAAVACAQDGIEAGYTFTHTEDDPIGGEHLWGTGIGWRF